MARPDGWTSWDVTSAASCRMRTQVDIVAGEMYLELFHVVVVGDRSEGFPARDIWFLGTLDQGSAQIPEFLGNRRCRRRRRRRLLETQVDIQARKL